MIDRMSTIYAIMARLHESMWNYEEPREHVLRPELRKIENLLHKFRVVTEQQASEVEKWILQKKKGHNDCSI